MKYVSLEDCRHVVFPYIYKQLTSTEPSAQYEQEQNGLDELNKVLHLVESDTFYPSFEDKGAYLLCSIAGSQYFSNGNKRLGVIVLMLFLIINDVELRTLTVSEYQKILADSFPRHTWEDNASIREGNPLFLYNLAIVIGDRNKWDEGTDFSALKQKAAKMFAALYRLSS